MSQNSRTDRLPRFLDARARIAAYLSIPLSLLVILALSPGQAHGDTRNGKDVVDTFCVACHVPGLEGAPKIGDEAAWRNRAAQGLSSLTQHAIEGIRKMPAHGGTGLSDLELARAVTHMVNRSGGNWVEPTSSADLFSERSGEQIVKAQCAKCHKDGVDGAPKIGDLESWAQRMKQGLGYATRSAIRGHGGMPPRGGQANLTDAEIRAAILYMYNPSGTPDQPPLSVAASRDREVDTDPNHKTVGGIDIYLGSMPARNLHALPAGAPERSMHGGIPQGSGYYHLNVSLFDAKSRAPIDNAQVQMRFEQAGRTGTLTKLERMEIGAGSYGNYVKPQPRYPYNINLRIEMPGATQAVEARFEHSFE